MLVQANLCSGCRTCELLCSLVNAGENNPRKAAIRVFGNFPAPGNYEVAVCDQCGECAEVCPVEAISLREGVYHIDAEACTACHLCLDVCPRKAMFLYRSEGVPIKCNLCGECIEYCPRKVLSVSE